MSETNAEVLDLSDMHYNLTVAQRLEIKRLHGVIDQLQRIGQFGAANDPLSSGRGKGLPNGIPPPSLYKTRPEFSLTQPLRTEHG